MTVPDRANATAQRFAERYELHEELGRGGMAVVYRATDCGTGRTVALKQLVDRTPGERDAQVALLFEREFQTLTQLKHPSVIEVYDYGVTADGACYYTMELLDGASLRDRVPVPWREACRLAFDVCSALALLHSRRLIHRDVSPRNVSWTVSGAAKLIDFGAVVPMSAGEGTIVGTPAFTAPEMVNRSALDGRTDLYSLGATLYYALTGQLAYFARNFSELNDSWKQPPRPPSVTKPEIPTALDDLLLSLLDVEPARRPPSAFAVMQRLAAIAGLERDEQTGVSRAYLTSPALTGRDAPLATLRAMLGRALHSGAPGLLLRGPTGIGRSRMLDACALEAKALGACVLRANVLPGAQDFDAAFALAEHLLQAMPREELPQQVSELFVEGAERPRLRDLAQLRANPEALERSLVQLMRVASKVQPLVFAVDDAHAIDGASAAVLATLLDRFRFGRAFAIITTSDAERPSAALDVLSRRCEDLTLEPLRPEQTQSLFASVFGDVPNLAPLAEQIHAIARGNPRMSLDLAQHLIDRRIITYVGGAWTLPNKLQDDALPSSAEDAIRARITRLSPLARLLAQAHALSFIEQLTDADYRGLAPSEDALAVDAAVRELLVEQALTSTDDHYSLAHRIWRNALDQSLDATTRERIHLTLAAWFRPRVGTAWVHHTLASETGDHDQAIDALLMALKQKETRSHEELLEENIGRLAPSHLRALELCMRAGRSRRQQHELRHALSNLAIVTGDVEYYELAAPAWREQLIHDSGLDLFWNDSQNSDAGARLTQALTKAFERYQALPEQERVYRPDEAIPRLAEYSGLAFAIAIRTMDLPLMRATSGLLQPFAVLSPVLDALWQNALSGLDCHEACRYDQARARWLSILERLRDATGVEVRHLKALRSAIAYGIGMVEAVFGLASAAHWADELDADPLQRLSGLYLRKIVRLEQGDWPGAEKLQRSAELLALRARVPPMFTSTFTVEISAHALARDLAGVQEVIERERAEAARFPGWIPYVREAEARFDLIRGDWTTARAKFENLIADTAPDAALRSPCMAVWLAAHGGLCETLLALDLPDVARATAHAALAVCDKLEIRTFASEAKRLLALAEAKLGDVPGAVARLDALIAEHNALGASGLRMGIVYEARAEVALLANDRSAFDTFARSTAREYRHGAGCPLSARYERLMNEARRRGIQVGLTLSAAEPALSGTGLGDLRSVVRLALSDAQGPSERYTQALRLVCEARAARGAHLYMPTDKGPRLVMTHGLSAPSPQLANAVQDMLADQEDRFETRTVAVHGIPPLSASAPVTRVEGTDYELLLLVHRTAIHAEISGVIALAPNQPDKPNPSQAQLIALIAEQLSAA